MGVFCWQLYMRVMKEQLLEHCEIREALHWPEAPPRNTVLHQRIWVEREFSFFCASKAALCQSGLKETWTLSCCFIDWKMGDFLKFSFSGIPLLFWEFAVDVGMKGSGGLLLAPESSFCDSRDSLKHPIWTLSNDIANKIEPRPERLWERWSGELYFVSSKLYHVEIYLVKKILSVMSLHIKINKKYDLRNMHCKQSAIQTMYFKAIGELSLVSS